MQSRCHCRGLLLLAVCVTLVCAYASAQTPDALGIQGSLDQSLDLPRSPDVRAAECSCGAYALYAVVRVLGSKSAFADVVNAVAAPGRAATLQELKRAAEHLGFSAYAIRLTPEDLVELRWPVVLYTNDLFAVPHEAHFVSVLGQKNAGDLVIYSPAKDFFSYNMADFSEFWDGESLVVTTWPVALEELLPYTSTRIQSRRSLSSVVLVALGVCLATVGAFLVHKALRRTPTSVAGDTP